MTHFNHEWDTTKTPAIPMSVGDRYYAQDLNDDFNYLKHLPYEVFLQGRSRGVMIAPSDTWDNDTNSLTLSGGFGVITQDNIELDPDESFVIPPKTHTSPRYERIPFADTTLVLPNDGATHYIVATPTKRSLLQRTKALFAEQYASRVRYDGIITIQDTAPIADQILIGLCNNKEYCLLIDSNPDQYKDNIILKKWFGQNKITQGFVSILQSYYNTTIASIETRISINTVSGIGVQHTIFNNCTINIDTVNVTAIANSTFNNCIIHINTVNNAGINLSTFNNCTVSIDTINGDNAAGIGNSAFDNCTISIGTVGSSAIGISVGGRTFNNCKITFDTVNGTAIGGNDGTFNNCTININTINNGGGLYSSTYNNCTIDINAINGTDVYSATGVYGYRFHNCYIHINTVNNAGGITGGGFHNCYIFIETVNGNGVENSSDISFYLTRVRCSATTNISMVSGKVIILNSTVLRVS